MTLDIQDFVAQGDGVDVEDIPPAVRDRLNEALGDLTGGENPTTGGDDGTLASLVVSADGNGDFGTIPGALNAIRNDEEDADVVFVEPGTYGQSVGEITVDIEDLELASTEGPDATTVQARVVVSADNATLDGLTVSPPSATSTSESEAIRVSNTPNNVTIENNIVDGLERGDSEGFYGIDGINAFGGDGSTPIENVTIRGNEVRELQNEVSGGFAGISIQGNVAGATVTDNTLSNLGSTGDGGTGTNYGFGIVIRGTGNHSQVPTGVTVQNNDISTVQSDDRQLVGVGLGVSSGGSDYVFESNDISNAELGVEIKAAATETTLSGNTFTGTEIHLADLTGDVNLTGVLGSNDFGEAAATDSVEPNSLRPGENPYKQAILTGISQAVENSASGAQIDVAPGTYDEAVTVDTQGLTIQSTGSPSDTELVADAVDDDNKALLIDGVDDVTIDGLRVSFTDMQASNSEKYGVRGRPDGSGSGPDNLTVRNCAIEDFASEDVDTNSGAVRATGIALDMEPTGGLGPATVNGATIESNTIRDIVCEGDIDQSDSRAKGISFNGDADGPTISGNDIVNIGTTTDDDPNVAEDVASSSAEGTGKPRGIGLTEDSNGDGATNFTIQNNRIEGVEGTYGQPSIFIGGTNSLGSNHTVSQNTFYHPVDNLSNGGPLRLRNNTWENDADDDGEPELVPADVDADGGNLIDRAGGGAYDTEYSLETA